jgi:dual specificity protein kinase YAK1
MGGYQVSGNAGLPSPRHKEVQQDRPYGGLPPTPARTSAHTYQDAAQYQQHLNQQQAHNAMATANAYRQAQFSNNPYALPASSMPDQLLQRHQQQPPQQLQTQQLQPTNPGYQVPKLPPISVTTPRGSGTNQHSPSQSMNMPSTAIRGSMGGPLSPNAITNPPQAHHYPMRGRSGTFSQMDVPPALQKLGLDLSSFKAIGTPQLRRDEQRAAWERRNTGNNELDRRRSLKQTNPHLEHLEYYAQTHPGNYYYPGPAGMQQPFSVVVDPRMSHQPHHAQAAAAVTVPPQAYSGQGGSYDAFDQFDARDGLNTMLHQPLLPTQTPSSSYYGHSASNSGSMHNGLLPSMGYAGPHQSPNANGESGMHSSGKQKRSDQQMFP